MTAYIVHRSVHRTQRVRRTHGEVGDAAGARNLISGNSAVGVRVPTGLSGQRAYDQWIGRELDSTLLYAFEASHMDGITKDGEAVPILRDEVWQLD